MVVIDMDTKRPSLKICNLFAVHLAFWMSMGVGSNNFRRLPFFCKTKKYKHNLPISLHIRVYRKYDNSVTFYPSHAFSAILKIIRYLNTINLLTEINDNSVLYYS